MFHLAAFYTNDLASGANQVSLGTVTDQALNSVNSQYQMPRDMRVLAGYVGAPDCTLARINSPQLRRYILPAIDPISLTALPANVPPLAKWKGGGPLIMTSEQFVVQASRAVVAAADAYALLWIGDTPTESTGGQTITIQVTSAITIAEGVWTAGALTFSDSLPAGNYDVVGMSSYGTNLLAGRLIFPGSQTERPGCLAQGAQGEWSDDTFRRGNFGRWGTFRSYLLPQVECFGVGAGTSQIHYLDIVPRMAA